MSAALHNPTAAFALPTSLRTRIEAAIERLIRLLDFVDGDPDLEASVGGGNDGHGYDAEADTVDDEPSLGWTGAEASRGRYARIDPYAVDIEVEHDGREPDDEDSGVDDERHDPDADEASLGWTAFEAATGQYPDGWFVNQDLEEQCDDEGVPDNMDSGVEVLS
jgi:hypothetical protein